MGARVIFQALQHMTKPGIIEHVVLIGAPVTNEAAAWTKARSVVAGRLVNAYSSEDWALRFLYRALDFGLGCAGLTPVAEDGGGVVDQVDIGVEVKGHFKLRMKLGEALWGAICGEPVEAEEAEQ